MVLSPLLFMCIMLAILPSMTVVADTYDLNSAAILLRFSSDIPKVWLERKQYGNAVSYGSLIQFGEATAKHILDTYYKNYEASQKQEREDDPEYYDEDAYIKNYLKDIKYHVTMDAANILRISFFGASDSADDAWYHIRGTIQQEDYEVVTSYAPDAFVTLYKANSPVIPDAPVDGYPDNDDVVFPTDLTIEHISARFYKYPETCANGKRDNDEVATDCGGVNCPPCTSFRCNVDDDCFHGYTCNDSKCVSKVAPNADSASFMASITLAVVSTIAIILTVM